MGKRSVSRRYNHLPLLRSRPGGVGWELTVQDLPAANLVKEMKARTECVKKVSCTDWHNVTYLLCKALLSRSNDSIQHYLAVVFGHLGDDRVNLRAQFFGTDDLDLSAI